jgi:transposase
LALGFEHDRTGTHFSKPSAGQIVREESLPNTRPGLAKLLADFPCATVALEAGTHSPWISRFLTEHGAKVLVANPRKGKNAGGLRRN